MTSSKVQTNALFVATLLACIAAPPAAFADRKDDLYAKGMAAVNAGKAVEARDAFCQVAKEDSEYKDAKQQCTDNTREADKVIVLHNRRWAEAQQLIQDGKYDEAEVKLKQIKYGDHIQEAQKKLADVGKLKLDKANADAANKAATAEASALNARFDQGVGAWNRGDFSTAKQALNGLTGPHADDARDYLKRIDRYESVMQQAASYASSKNFSAAVNSYNSAVAINPNGPGDPVSKVEEMNKQMASASNTTQPPVNTAAVKPVNNAEKPVDKIDEAKYLADAQSLAAKKKYAQARKLINKVLAQNYKNSAAADALKALPQETTQPGESNPADEDPVLAAAIRNYYNGNYDEAEGALNFYLGQPQVKKPGLSNFYLGVSLMTRYFLAGESDQSLRLKAVKRFLDAKMQESKGFKVPEKFVSPKIMALYNQTKAPTTSNP